MSHPVTPLTKEDVDPIPPKLVPLVRTILKWSSRLNVWIYEKTDGKVGGKFLGGAITTRMVQLINHSPAFRDLMRDVFSGSQDYRTLKRRLWNQVGATMLELARSFFGAGGTPHAHSEPRRPLT